MKRISLLLVAIALCTLLVSPSAFACARCAIDHQNPDCAICRYGALFGGDDCEFYPPLCDLCDEVGDCGGGLASTISEVPLATQYTVASVERLDEPHNTPGAVQTAHITSQPTR